MENKPKKDFKRFTTWSLFDVYANSLSVMIRQSGIKYSAVVWPKESKNWLLSLRLANLLNLSFRERRFQQDENYLEICTTYDKNIECNSNIHIVSIYKVIKTTFNATGYFLKEIQENNIVYPWES